MNILIVGAGIAGHALAFWLQRSRCHHSITILEKAPSLRETGLQIDLRGPGIEVLKRMGLEKTFRNRLAPEQGVEVVDSRGRKWGWFPARGDKEKNGLQGFTTDWEIMRGDLVRLLREASGDRVLCRFGMTVKGYEEQGDGVEVTFSDGSKERFDLMVGADGVHSHTRRLMLEKQGQSFDAALKPTAGGSVIGYYTMPMAMRVGDRYCATVYFATGKRGYMIRRSDAKTVQVYAGGLLDPSLFSDSQRGDIQAEKGAMATFMTDAGWRSDELVAGMLASEDFYCERLAMVQMERWHRGRTVLLGDAAYCPSAVTGMGTTCALVGAYVLAGELVGMEENCVEAALGAYETKFAPYMAKVQEGLAEDDGGSLPDGKIGIAVIYALVWVASLLKINVAKYMLKEDIKGWELPNYTRLANNSTEG